MPYVPRRRAPRRRLWARAPHGKRIGPRRRIGKWRARAVAVLTLTTAICTGYLAWELVATTWLARAHQREALSALTAAWDRHSPSATRDGVAVDGIVRIPRLGPTYAVPLIEGTDPASLALGVGHIVGTAHPGQVGNVVLAGHRITHGEPFRHLPELRRGDEVLIDTLVYRYVYRVTSAASDLRVRKDATWVLAATPRDPTRPGSAAPGRPRLITLITCAELFHTDERVVVVGELVRTVPRLRIHPQA